MFFLLSDVEKKRKHKTSTAPPPIIPVEGALRMLQTRATPRTLPFVLIQFVSSFVRAQFRGRYSYHRVNPPIVNVGESALPLHTPLCWDVVTCSQSCYSCMVAHVLILLSDVEKKRKFHAVKKWHCILRRGKVDVLVFFGRSAPFA